MNTKTCKDCGEAKDEVLFNKDPRMAAGFSNVCKACKVIYNRKRRDMARSGELPLMHKTHKTCATCGKEKTIDRFYRESGSLDGHSCKCKDCKREQTYEWRAKNRDEYNRRARQWGAKNPEKRHAHEIKRRYGCSLEQYNSMLVAQEGACSICKSLHNPEEKRGRLYVDHCHSSDKIRALLCGSCNSLLGYAKDDPRILLEAVAYLARHKS